MLFLLVIRRKPICGCGDFCKSIYKKYALLKDTKRNAFERIDYDFIYTVNKMITE
jgi:hypothetical protein